MSEGGELEDLELENFRERKLRLIEEARAYLQTCVDEGNAVIDNEVLVIQAWTYVNSRKLEKVRREAAWQDTIKTIDEGREFSVEEFTKRLDLGACP